MKAQTEHTIFFLGLGGIGMSALARYFAHIGYRVFGYDKTPSALTRALEREGMVLIYKDDISALPEEVRADNRIPVVYTPAIPSESLLLGYFREKGYALKKRARVLGEATAGTHCLAVAGTHGKTTTSAILAHLLKEADVSFSAFLGGISLEWDSNFYFGGTEYTVVEADEFDRSFLELSPSTACVTSMDADHLDIYGEAAQVTEGFKAFAQRLKEGGRLFYRFGLPLQGQSFGFEKEAGYRLENIRITNSTYLFDVVMPSVILKDVAFGLPGKHNLMNALAALAMAAETGAPLSRLAQALGTFKGVARRFNTHLKSEKCVYIDDYAHHPAELDAVAEAVRSFYPGRRVCAVFQPHLFSRTRDFGPDFARSLAQFDEVVLLEIYPAREKPITGINASWLLEQIPLANKRLVEKDVLPEILQQSEATVFLTLGAGDIGNEVDTVINALTS